MSDSAACTPSAEGARIAEDCRNGRRAGELALPSLSAQGWSQPVKSAAFLLLALCALGLVAAYNLGVPGMLSGGEEPTAELPPPPAVERDGPWTLVVPEEVRTALGIRTGNREASAVAVRPRAGRPLVLPGSTLFDPARLVRLRARFAPAEVVEIGTRQDLAPDGSRSETRELRTGDRVHAGQLLAVFYSVDVAAKKNDLVDALVQLRLDEDILDMALKRPEAVPEVFLRTARRNVEVDHNAINRALNALRIWNIPPADIRAVEHEAVDISRRQGKRDPEKTRDWGKVELRSPIGGTVVERNVALHETVVDNTVNLFQIAQVERLVVVAYAPEDELPTVLKLPPERRTWTVCTLDAPAAGLRGPIDEIGQLIDPNVHAAIVKGRLENPHGALRAGQTITATIDLPPPDDVVEVPVSAVVSDGRQSLVFVQPDASRPRYTLRRVDVAQRFEKTVLVRSKLPAGRAAPAAADKDHDRLQPEPLLPGERVLTVGVLELKKELQDREEANP